MDSIVKAFQLVTVCKSTATKLGLELISEGPMRMYKDCPLTYALVFIRGEVPSKYTCDKYTLFFSLDGDHMQLLPDGEEVHNESDLLQQWKVGLIQELLCELKKDSQYASVIEPLQKAFNNESNRDFV